jgi:hypothetical protein
MQWWGIVERDGNNDAIHERLMITAAPCLLYDYIALPEKHYDSFVECRRPLFCFYYTAMPRAVDVLVMFRESGAHCARL